MSNQLPLTLAACLPYLDPFAELEECFTEKVSEDGGRHCNARKGIVGATEISDDGSGLVDSSCNEFGIFAVCRVPICTVKDPDRVVAIGFGRQGPKGTDEATLVVDLRLDQYRNIVAGTSTYLELWSRRHV